MKTYWVWNHVQNTTTFELGLYDVKFKYAEEEALRKLFLKKYSITRIFKSVQVQTTQKQ